MNEEIEYAEMLEIPVSTVNVVRKKRARKRKFTANAPKTQAQTLDLKESVLAQVNDKLEENAQGEKVTADADLFAESANSAGTVSFDDIPERIDTVRLYSASEQTLFGRENDAPFDLSAIDEERENEGGRYALNEENKKNRAVKIALSAEFALASALCATIFLTNVFMPNSAVNTFFRSLTKTDAVAQTDERTYADFTLAPVVSDLSDAQLNLSDTGILTFKDACCVYAVADGEIRAITQNEDGSYTVKISHSDSFSGVIEGLQTVYYALGDEVKCNVPLGYSDGEREVQVTMYSDGALLNCMYLTDENCLSWVTDGQLNG